MSEEFSFILFFDGFADTDNVIINCVIDAKGEKNWIVKHSTFPTEVLGNYYPHRDKDKDQNELLKSLNLKLLIHNKEFTFATSEIAFQASKCDNVKDVQQFADIDLHSEDAFKLGQNVTLRSDWEPVKISAMRYILLEKFRQNERLKANLINTNNTFIIEHHPEKGKGMFWADGGDGTGENVLGELLMEIRAFIGGSGKSEKARELLPELYQFLEENKHVIQHSHDNVYFCDDGITRRIIKTSLMKIVNGQWCDFLNGVWQPAVSATQ
jgi:ribA/ribD-fused uncharacterized protein